MPMSIYLGLLYSPLVSKHYYTIFTFQTPDKMPLRLSKNLPVYEAGLRYLMGRVEAEA
jgi:hypothetical protein